MKKIFNLVAVGMVLASVNVNAQTYVNEMTQADVERDCYIEGGSALFNDAADAYYGDGSYVQKSSASTPTAFIFNRDIWGNKNLTGFIVNVLVPNDRMDFGSENWQEVVIDLEEYIGSTFKQFYFSPNEKFGTDNVAVAETTYLDNIYISDVATSSGIADNVVSTSKVWGGKGALYVEGEAGEMSVYSVSGMEIGKYALNGFLQIDIERGIYLVKIGDTTSKIVVY